ncbi:MAG: tRNA pseudouridine(55) synthase TruB [Clostridia bacterium]|nr:tRNA pseudouridine(55) synthase TruB [Clostridia bacterium]
MDGFLNVLKPPGMSSGAVVAMCKRLTGARVGHAGTLDPEAAGVLPVMVGKATRLFDLLVDKRKVYLAEIAFGTATDTQDAQGRIVERGESYPTAEAVQAVLPRFTGEIMQVPPAYSALKMGGETLYKLALKGKTPEIPARPIFVEHIDFLNETPRHGMLLRVSCGRGTYIRTLCHDIGAAVGCPAHMRFLLREQTGDFTLETAQTIEELKAAAGSGTLERLLLPLDMPLSRYARFDVPERLQKLCLNGVRLRADESPQNAPAGAYVLLYAQGRFIGVSCAEADGSLAARVVF